MSLPLKSMALAALMLSAAPLGASAQASGSGETTRYWDCCKPRYVGNEFPLDEKQNKRLTERVMM